MSDPTIQRLLRAWQKVEQDYRRAERDRESIQRALSLAGISINELQADSPETEESSYTFSSTQEVEDPSLQAMGATILRSKSESENGHTKIRTTQEMRNAIAEFEGEFTQQDVLMRIAEKHPGAKVRAGTISSALWRMASKGEIEKVRDGYGSEPNAYRRSSSTSLQEGFSEEESESDGEDTTIERETMS